MLLRLIAVTSLLQCVASHPTFQTYIPNGANVPLPCNPNQSWPGVGHFLVAGTGARNPFGVDFEAAGKTWTKSLCEKDSDGDGRSNGVELGDPQCMWKTGDIPANSTGLSHPGICEPINDTACQQKIISWGEVTTQKQWLDQVCKTEGFQCPALHEPDVANITVRLPPGTQVPAKETTYTCMMFNLSDLGVPDNKTFHMVAVTPIIDNARVVHHMILFGCQDDVEIEPGPYECGMVASEKCMQFLHVYTVGLDGECYHNQSGVRIGLDGYKYLAVQVHWNNVGSAADYTDTTGLKLYYTPHLKQYDAGVLVVGSNMFHLPPRRESVIIHSTCASGCTRQYMAGPIHVTFAWNHMHYTGRKMSIAIFRNGAFLTNLTNDETYSYDNPQVNLYPNPVILLPGDEFSVTCQYNTLTRNRTVFYGQATQDEMCYGFVTYFPLQNYKNPFCVDEYGISNCNRASWEGCELNNFLFQATTNSTLVPDVIRDCRYLTPCIPECVDTLVKHFKSEPCLKGNVWEYLQYALALRSNGQYILGYIASCKEQVYQALNPTPTPDKDDKDVGIRTATGSMCVLLLGVAVAWMSS